MQARVRNHNLRVYLHHSCWTKARLTLCLCNLKQLHDLAAFVCLPALESDWVEHYVATDDTNQVIWHEKLPLLGGFLVLQNPFYVALQLFNINILVAL